jgi:hypothetical protein
VDAREGVCSGSVADSSREACLPLLGCSGVSNPAVFGAAGERRTLHLAVYAEGISVRGNRAQWLRIARPTCSAARSRQEVFP